MAIYHVNPRDGNVGKCNAKEGKCPFGSEEHHFTSAEAARAAFEANQETFVRGASNAKRSWAKRMRGVPSDQREKILRRVEDAEVFIHNVEWGKIDVSHAQRKNLVNPPLDMFDESEITMDDQEIIVEIDDDYCSCDPHKGHERNCLARKKEFLDNHPGAYADGGGYEPTRYSFQITYDAMVKHLKQEVIYKDYLNKKRHLKNIDEGAPPWNILEGDGDRFGLYQLAKERFPQDLKTAEERVAIHNALSSISKKLKRLEDIDEKELSALKGKINTPRWERLNKVNKYLAQERELAAHAKALENAIAEAEALPDGPLKDAILGDRPPQVFEDKKRLANGSVKTVQRIWKRGSILREELSTARRKLSNKKTYGPIHDAKKLVSEESLLYSNAPEQLDQVRKTYEKRRIEAWRAGWTGKLSDLPPIPKEF